MSAEPRIRYEFTFSLLFILCALACFIAALCFTQGWLTLGTWQAWISGGLIFSTLAKIL